MAPITIATFTKMARKISELYPPDYENLVDPTYLSFARDHRPSLLIRLLEWARVKSPPLLSSVELTKLFKTVIETRTTTTTLSLKADSRCIVFGEFNGAFHSALRSIEKCVELGLLDEELRVVSESDYLIFSGNFIGKSHVNMELLALILTILEKNPHQAQCLQGVNEHNGEWSSFDLTESLATRFPRLRPILIDQFIDTLPERLTLSINSMKIEITQHVEATGDKLAACIVGKDRTYTYQLSRGLEKLPAQEGIPAWNLFSSPTYVNQQLYQFFNDAFTLLECSNKKFTLYAQDTRQMEGFKTSSYHLLTGKAFDARRVTTAEEVRLGISLDLSGGSLGLGLRLRAGIDLAINEYNDQSTDYQLHPIYLNDQYSPYLAKKNIERFVREYNTNLIFSSLGTPTTESYLPLVEKEEIAVLFPYTGANRFRQPGLNYFIHFRTSYQNEAKALVEHAYHTLQIKRYAFFYQNDSYGKAPLQGAIDSLQGKQDVEFMEASYSRNNPNVNKAAATISDFDPEAIFFFSTYAPSATLIHTLSIHNLANVSLLGISFLTDVFRNLCHSMGLQFTISRVVPSLEHSDLEIVTKFNAAQQTYYGGQETSTDEFEGYLNVMLLAEMLSRVSGRVTKESLIEAAKNFRDFDFHGLQLNYDPQTKELFHSLWIDTGEGDYIPYHTDSK